MAKSKQTAEERMHAMKMLLDENLIHTDKIGSSSVFWALKSEATAQRLSALEKLRAHKSELECALNALKRELSERKCVSPEEVQRAEEMSRQLSELRKQVAEAASNDPIRINTMIKENQYARDAVIRWTDNICCIRQFMKQRFGVSEEEVNRRCGIPPGIDDLQKLGL
ncbi:Mnd1 family protein [Besnoitia besnoiti]|uniref:Mnd1 family protein n=1 Tax=Besnoitia besnoiti TaxID=94643 RepID=A0A2A9M8R2_BESBE|nr:Mnd1 family protein [Besnoitia besnoiti]PFH32017.1 Mnd1 family protein [Besnoitia besnoiti]